MLRILVKKQLLEVFKNYFCNPKKNTKRSKIAVALWFVFFAVIMIGFLGGVFTALSLTLCGALTKGGMGWLYFSVMGGIAILLGSFGSVFNTYAGLYLSKDNDLLLSMPIPVRSIIAARLLNVWLMGTMYASVVLLPALIVYWAVVGATAARVICGLALFAVVTLIVLMLSTLLGWVVAKISLKLKNRSFITVLVSLAFVGAYYFFYFKANDLIKDLVANAYVYGARIQGAVRGVYLFGRIGEGDWGATALYVAVCAALTACVWVLLSRSFLAIATSSGRSEHVRYREKPVRQKSPFAALVGKELGRFFASPNYMLNCGFGMLLLPAAGVLVLLKGRVLVEAVEKALAGNAGAVCVLACAVLCMAGTMNDIAAPSVSLEGKSLWIPQSLPVMPRAVLRAKAATQLLLTGVPMLFAVLCAVIALGASAATALVMCLTPLLYAAFFALFSVLLSVKLPILHWTSEIAPIKQSAAVAIALFGGWAVCLALGGLYLWVGHRLGPTLYLGIWAGAFAAASLILLRWLDTRGAAAFAAL